MIEVEIYNQSNFDVDSKRLKKAIVETLRKKGVVSDISVSLAIVDRKKMQELVDQYYKDDPQMQYEHPILTFPDNEIKGTFIEPADMTKSLGEIIISYDHIVSEAEETSKSIDEVAEKLAIHGALHLLGKHH